LDRAGKRRELLKQAEPGEINSSSSELAASSSLSEGENAGHLNRWVAVTHQHSPCDSIRGPPDRQS